jgi:hypothetical protein
MDVQPAPPAKLKPSGIWYGIGITLIVLGIVGAIVIWVIGFKNVSDTVDNFARFRAPSTRVLTFNSSGTFTIYYEGSSDRQDVPPLQISVVDENGNDLDLQTGNIPDVTFSVNGHNGVAVARVKIPDPGRYTIEVQSSSPGSFDVSVGKGVVARIVVFVLAGIAVGFFGVVLGVITLIVTGVKRGRRKREAQAALAPAGPGQWGMAPTTAWGSPPTVPPTAAPPAPPWSPEPASPPPSGGGRGTPLPPPPPPPPT